MSEVFRFTVNESNVKTRLDVYLANNIQNTTRNQIKKAIEEARVLVNGEAVKPNYKIKANDEIVINILPPKNMSLLPEDIPLEILYEDKDIIVVNKPRGMVVHPAPGNYSGTLVNALLYHSKSLSRINSMRPGIVHRLDKDTSGVIVAAKNDYSHDNLSKQLKKRQVKKIYRAIVWGNILDNSAKIIAPIGRNPIKRTKMAVNTSNSRKAVSYFQVLERFSDFTHVEVAIQTGRTHQIRVHMKFIGHPVLGDPVYSKKKNPFKIKGQALHAYKLGFLHPANSRYMEFTAPIPDDFNSVLRILREREG